MSQSYNVCPHCGALSEVCYNECETCGKNIYEEPEKEMRIIKYHHEVNKGIKTLIGLTIGFPGDAKSYKVIQISQSFWKNSKAIGVHLLFTIVECIHFMKQN